VPKKYYVNVKAYMRSTGIAPRRIFGPKRNEVTGEWRRIRKKELYALYSSPNIQIKNTEMEGPLSA
jgi:hypothetical protein